MANKINVLTNIPFMVQFKYDKPKVWDNVGQDGKAYQTFSYAVIHQGVDTYLNADWKLQPMLEKMGNLKDKEFQLLKYQDGKYTNWKIMDVHGNDITPTAQYTPQPQNAPQTSFPQQQAQTPTPDQFKALEDKIRAAFAARDKQIGEQLEMIMDLKQKLAYMTGLFKEHSKDAFEVHKDQLETEIPVITEEDLKNFGK